MRLLRSTTLLLLISGLLIPALGLQVWEIALYEVLMFSCVQIQHANIGLPPALDRLFRTVFVTPEMHKIHHSRRQPETDSNYTSFLSVWDRLFRSYRTHDSPKSIRFGLSQYSDPSWQSLSGLLMTPFRSPTPATPKATAG